MTCGCVRPDPPVPQASAATSNDSPSAAVCTHRLPVQLVRLVPPLATGNVPVTPVVKGNPVAFVNVPDAGVPSAPPPNNSTPLPLSSVMADRKFAEEGVARNVATPVPRPDTPVAMGRPVALVSVPLAGVPKAGFTIVQFVTVRPDFSVNVMTLVVLVSVRSEPVEVKLGSTTALPFTETESPPAAPGQACQVPVPGAVLRIQS